MAASARALRRASRETRVGGCCWRLDFLSICFRSPGRRLFFQGAAEPSFMVLSRSPTLRSSAGIMPLRTAPRARGPREIRPARRLRERRRLRAVALESRCEQRRPIFDAIVGHAEQAYVGGGTDKALLQVLAKAVVDGQRDDERGHARGHSGDRDASDDADERPGGVWRAGSGSR